MFTAPSHPLSDWTSPARSDWVIRERIGYERVATMLHATPFPIWVGLLFGAVCGYVLLRLSSAPVVVGWATTLAALSVLRLWQVRRFRSDPQRRARSMHWRLSYLGLMLPYGLTWSAMLLFLGPRLGSFEATFIILALLGVASVGVYTVQSVFQVSAAWLLSIGVPVVAWSLARGDVNGVVLASGTVMLMGVLMHESLRNDRLQSEALRLRLENATIAEDRAQALALAEESNRARTRFLATVSHEMRTPLNGIVGISELMRDQATDPLLRQRADVVLRSAEQLHHVIGDLLDLSRLEFGRLGLESAPFDPAQALREVLALSAPLAAERGLAIDLTVAASVPRWVSGDAARFRQVVHNLLSNALHFTLEGQVSVSLSPSAQGLRCVVSDTGPGIAAERLDNLFEPFSDPGGDSRRSGQGVGLGLSISRRLARAMHGDLVCESEPGRGSRFTFTLQAPVAGEPVRPAADAEGLPAFRGHVLVVDDNEVNALVAQAMLLRLGLSCDIATDGQQALEQMGRGRHDVVLMDCRMPTLDGWQATRRWRERERLQGGGSNLPIVGVTANVSDEDRQHCLDCGMNDFLGKPFRIHALAEVLKPHLTRAVNPSATRQSAA